MEAAGIQCPVQVVDKSVVMSQDMIGFQRIFQLVPS